MMILGSCQGKVTGLVFAACIIFLTGCGSARYHTPLVSTGLSGPQSPADLASGQPFLWPVEGTVVKPFGSEEEGVPIKGIWLEARRGGEVRAARDGRVVFLDPQFSGYGKTIILEHADNFSTVYAHNSEILVGLGQWVRRGEVIAKIGAPGSNGKPRIYFEIRKDAKAENPSDYLPR